MKWAGAGAAALLGTTASLLIVLTVAGVFKLHARTAPVPDLKVVGTPERIQRGQAIASSFCDGCHSKTGSLTGGFDIGKELGVSIGSFVSSNLTPAGELSHWSDGEIFRAIRNGIDADGRWLVIMSYTSAGHLSDEDIEALIAYIRSRPAVGRPTARRAPAARHTGRRRDRHRAAARRCVGAHAARMKPGFSATVTRARPARRTHSRRRARSG